MDEQDDPYVTGTCRWWHLTEPSAELLAAEAAGLASSPGVVVDLGCGLGTEVAYLTGRGWRGLGIDLSAAALARARARHHAGERGASFARADVTRLPLAAGSADLLLDRGCFHYLGAPGRAAYAAEVWRVLRPGGCLLLRMCLTSAGEPNGLGEHTIREAFGDWDVSDLRQLLLASDTRTMKAIMAVLVRRGASHPVAAGRADRQDIDIHVRHN